MNPGEEHRASRVHRRPGAKGVNVAAALGQLGEPVVATGLADEEFANHAEEPGLQTAFVHGLPRLRRTVAVVEPGRRSGACGRPLPRGRPIQKRAAAGGQERTWLTPAGGTDKQGSPPVRWALVEAIQHVPVGHPLR